jgi:phosphoglycerate dehydrogenase-like enzyme
MPSPPSPLEVLITAETRPSIVSALEARCPFARFRIGPHVSEAGVELDPELTDGVHVLACELPPPRLDGLDALRWIQLTSSGYAQVLDLPLRERQIRVTNGLGNFDGPIAEWNVLMMLMWRREMLEQLDNQKHARFNRDARYQRDLFGGTVGFWGYGGLARETARLAKALNLNVWALTRDGTVKPRPDTYCVAGTGDPQGRLPDRVFGLDESETFLQGLDYLIVAVPLTDATRGMIGERELRLLPPDAVLINPARAPIVQLDPLLEALSQRWFRGASLDVHYAYPLPKDHPLWQAPNLIMTPHISGSSASPQFMERFYDILATNLERYSTGRPMLNELTEDQLAGR